MDGRNCTGRKISLLNDTPGSAPAPPSACSSSAFAPSHSRTLSRASSSTSSPTPTPPELLRSSSSDSSSGESPLTPVATSFFDARALSAREHSHAHHSHHHSHLSQLHSHHRRPSGYLTNHLPKMDEQSASLYPPLPDANMPAVYHLPQHISPQMPPQHVLMQQSLSQQPLRTSNSPSSEPSRVSNASAQSGAASTAAKSQQPKKNQYPCPMAKQVGCTDFFTTSGHAARHAKKHTGKKDAFCPECNKAFTRKDNMEQHRRTHQNGRGSSRTSDDAKVKKPAKQSAKKSVPSKVETQLEAALEQQLADQAQHAAAAAAAAAVQAQAQPTPQQPAVNLPTAEQALLLSGGGPYFLNNAVDTGPVPPLPMAMPDLGLRPALHRSSFANSLEYVPPTASMIDPDTLHYSYPSPGLSNGLNSLALAACEHRRMAEKPRSPHSPSSEEESPQEMA